MLEHIAYKLAMTLHKAGPALLGKEISNIVTTHSIGASVAALGAAWVPGAGASVAVAISAGFVWSMYYRINQKLGILFRKNVLKCLATAIGANVVTAVVSSIIVSSLLTFVPGLGTLAGEFIMACVTFSLTWTCGLVYLKVLIRFAEIKRDMSSVSEDELKKMAEEVLESENVKEMMKNAKKEFKRAKDSGAIRKDADVVRPMNEEEA